ncbi:MAG: hypothetical protein IT177_15015 [Acidobacteria bacterium]|nr:hypothetical protein [Acidobacteriota bacterium]
MPLLPRRPLTFFLLLAVLAVPAAALVAQGRAATRAQPASSARVPEPKDVFGFAPGDDYKLASHEQILDYFRKLDAASDRIVVEEIGKSTLGRPMILAAISSEANIKNRARYQEIARQLAIARGVDEPKARALAKEGKAIVWIDGGLHATRWPVRSTRRSWGGGWSRPRKTRRAASAKTPS